MLFFFCSRCFYLLCSAEYKVVFGMNDFDEATIFDFRIDVWRCAVSIYNHALTNKLSVANAESAVLSFVNLYLNTVQGYVDNERATVFEITTETATKGSLISKFLKETTDKGTLIASLFCAFSSCKNRPSRSFCPASFRSLTEMKTFNQYEAAWFAHALFASLENAHEQLGKFTEVRHDGSRQFKLGESTSLAPVSPATKAAVRQALSENTYGATLVKVFAFMATMNLCKVFERLKKRFLGREYFMSFFSPFEKYVCPPIMFRLDGKLLNGPTRRWRSWTWPEGSGPGSAPSVSIASTSCSGARPARSPSSST